MKLLIILKNRKILLLNIFLTLYIVINLIGGERGLISYVEKKNLNNKLATEYKVLKSNLEEIENKNTLLSDNINIDYLDKLYREKLKFGKKNEILIKLN